MANITNSSIFDYPDPSLTILKEAAGEDSSELLKNRLVSKTWQNYSDNLIENFWRDLRQVDLQGPCNIGQAMIVIDAEKPATPAVLKLAKLMNVFKKHGCSFNNHSPVLVMINNFQKLLHELALKAIWPRLRQLSQLSTLEDLPNSDAAAVEIRSFLYNHQNVLGTILLLKLDGLGLKLLPPELKLLKGLRSLNLDNNNLSDISSLRALTNLTHLPFSNNNLSDISSLSALTNLTHLALDNNNLSDISSLSALTSLTLLRLNNNQLSDISSLSALTKLTQLALNNNQLSNISCLGILTKLTTLGLSNNQLSDISCLRALTKLTMLRLNDNNLSDISCLSTLINLTQLWLSNNNLSDISSLSALTKLTILTLRNNNLSDISSLSALTKLTILTLRNNQLTKIPNFNYLKHLSTFDIDGNPLVEVPVSPPGFSVTGKRTHETAFGEQQ